ncbi:hypothetical protein MtrunA17_Chr2g0282351 [Medicago truncatula]|uniref:Ubiquitin-protein ligase, putative n=1 Tax=Medicago truncatula TaxID=3880 RepID=Q2HTT1_MEDTR|nr:hypothetical protein MtrDRAFT_AC149801g7v2 [Medicago truncatula]AES63844.1 ubiquitin-protein ligase, putative [Medicago truncatula]RHN71947.1 hypothetical protein MtrunA17_Chr2g0282351 [Medicago truncatula]
MVYLEDSRSNSNCFPLPKTHQYHSSISSKSQRNIGRSSIFDEDNSSCTFTERSTCVSKSLIDSVVDLCLGELASKNNKYGKSSTFELRASRSFSSF